MLGLAELEETSCASEVDGEEVMSLTPPCELLGYLSSCGSWAVLFVMMTSVLWDRISRMPLHVTFGHSWAVKERPTVGRDGISISCTKTV